MMEELFLQVLNMSLMASVVILVVVLLRIPLKKVPKNISYALWSVVLFRLVCPFSFESIFSLLPSAKPLPQEILTVPNPIINSGFPILDQAVNLPSPALGDSINPMQVLLFISSIVWIFGVFVLVCYSVISYLLLKCKVRTAMLVESNVYECEAISSPFVLGIMKPKVYLPLGLSATQRPYILKHEQTHIKRFDMLIKPIAFLVLCVHWFNPLCWLAFALMSKDMELSCDEAVIKAMGSEIKCDYSTSLLSLATGLKMPNGSPLAFGESNVKARIENILNYKKPAFWVVMVTIVAVVAVGIGLVANPKNHDTSITIGTPVTNKIMASATLDNGFEIQLILVDGRTFSGEEAGSGGGIYDINFNGDYELQVHKDGKVISKIQRDAFQSIVFSSGLNFPSEFKLVVGDYNGDGNADFSIGQFSGSSGNSYLLFTVDDNGKIKNLKTSTDLRVQSHDFSIGFNNIAPDTFEFKAYNNAIAASEKYRAKWNGTLFDIQQNEVYSLDRFENGDFQLSITNTIEFSEFGERNEGFAYYEKAKNQIHIGITTAIGQPIAADENPVGSLTGPSVQFDIDLSSADKPLHTHFKKGGSDGKMKLIISDDRLMKIGMRFYAIIEKAAQKDNAIQLLSWAQKLSVHDVKSMELLIEPSSLVKRYKKYLPNEFADILKRINESKGNFMPYSKELLGKMQTLYITQNDGQKHTVTNAGNIYLIIDGQYYKGDSALLRKWDFKGNKAVPAEFYKGELPTAAPIKEGALSPDDFVKETVASFQIKEGVARFLIPSKTPSGYELSQLSVHVAGSMPMGKDSEMSLHAFEQADIDKKWELGQEYTERMFDTNVPDGTEVYINVSLQEKDGSGSSHNAGNAKIFPLRKDDFIPNVKTTTNTVIFTNKFNDTLKLTLSLPKGFTMKAPIQGDASNQESSVELYNDGDLIGFIWYSDFDLYRSEHGDIPYMSVYTGIMNGSGASWDSEYTEIRKAKDTCTAICKPWHKIIVPGVAGAAQENAVNKGILAYDATLLKYVAIYLDDQAVTQAQLVDISKSVKLSQ